MKNCHVTIPSNTHAIFLTNSSQLCNTNIVRYNEIVLFQTITRVKQARCVFYTLWFVFLLSHNTSIWKCYGIAETPNTNTKPLANIGTYVGCVCLVLFVAKPFHMFDSRCTKFDCLGTGRFHQHTYMGRKAFSGNIRCSENFANWHFIENLMMRVDSKLNFDNFKQIIPRKMFFKIDLYGDQVGLNIKKRRTPAQF